MVVITIRDVEFIAYRLTKELLVYDEPIPDFSTRFPNVLESCLVTPFLRMYGRDLYPSLLAKAGSLFYLIIKNHPFKNGNKRIAVTSLFFFLYKNKKWLKVSNQELYNFSVWVAESPAELKDETVMAIVKFLKSHLTDLRSR